MNKFLFASLILGSAFALTSCSADEPAKGGNEGTVSLTVQLPKQLATRFASAGYIDKLYFSVCSTGENAAVLDNYNDVWPEGQTATTVDIPLIPGQTYQVVFFACNSDATTLLDEETTIFTTGYAYNPSTGDFKVNYANAMTNNDA